ncbi:cytochrome c oxidase assembly protein [Saccharibacillus kuerlensis]|uniref:Membrane protein n=1 Tax=Saccharibacillus kuerlensis TaxID=459527 RepID=A0ABQ2L4Y8_9BACL|nr:cytochrome c oxidase assembly protein [Saccharibacillus kuerlensis]GGO03698.1 membrane protein [Saccharibacillus kuerlensis]
MNNLIIAAAAHNLHHHGDGISSTEAVQPLSAGLIDYMPVFFISIPLIAVYLTAAVLTGRRYRRWSLLRSLLWCTGVTVSASAITGPLAQAAHASFTAHMLGHLLLGMLGPLLIALSAPITLLLRSLPRRGARFLSALLRSQALAFLSNPVTASLLNVGGLWILYTTGLYTVMHHSTALHILVHFHVFAAGYLFTISVLPVDPAPHRTSFGFRAGVMIAAFAAHGILSKYLYANPPIGTASEDARIGAQLMYYGGDGVDLLLIILFCYRWYRQGGRQSDKQVSDNNEERSGGIRSNTGKKGYT